MEQRGRKQRQSTATALALRAACSGAATSKVRAGVFTISPGRLLAYSIRFSLLQSGAIAAFRDRGVEGLVWLLGTVGTPAPELVEPPCARIVSHEPRDRLGEAGRV
jgi:hypothetical protein